MESGQLLCFLGLITRYCFSLLYEPSINIPVLGEHVAETVLAQELPKIVKTSKRLFLMGPNKPHGNTLNRVTFLLK